MSLFYVHQISLSPGPSISVMVTANGAPELGQNGYSLTCGVSGAGNLSPTITYRWTRDNGTQTQVGTNSNTLSFSPLRLSDVGQYTCGVTITSPFLNSEITMGSSNSQTVTLQSELLSLYHLPVYSKFYTFIMQFQIHLLMLQVIQIASSLMELMLL